MPSSFPHFFSSLEDLLPDGFPFPSEFSESEKGEEQERRERVERGERREKGEKIE